MLFFVEQFVSNARHLKDSNLIIHCWEDFAVKLYKFKDKIKVPDYSQNIE